MEAVKMVAQMGNVDLGDFTFYEETTCKSRIRTILFNA